MSALYLDANSTTRLHADVLAAMMPYLTEEFGNPLSAHSFGAAAARAMDEARFTAARFLNSRTNEIVFTSSGTEANNLALIGSALAAGPDVRSLCIVTSAIEHSSVLEACRFLETFGASVRVIDPDADGRVSAAAVCDAAVGGRVLVSLMLANNETGVLQPVREIAAEVRGRGVIVHCDAVQAAGKIPIDVQDLGVDFLSISAHKMEGPKGSGLLYIRQGRRVEAILRGGPQENRLRGGTHNLAGIVGLAAALGRSAERIPEKAAAMSALRDRFEQAVLDGLAGTSLNGARAQRLCNTSNISFPGVRGDALLARLNMAGLAASRGSACSSGASRPSHVLLAMGLPETLAASSMRFSLHPGTTGEEVDRAARIVVDTVRDMRNP